MAQQLPVEANEGKRKCDSDDLERPSKIRSIERPNFQNRPATFDRANENWVLGPQFTSWAAAERYGPLFSLRSSSMVEIWVYPAADYHPFQRGFRVSNVVHWEWIEDELST